MLLNLPSKKYPTKIKSVLDMSRQGTEKISVCKIWSMCDVIIQLSSFMFNGINEVALKLNQGKKIKPRHLK